MGGGGTFFSKALDALTHKLPESPAGLKKYEILVVGNTFGATFTKRMSHLTHGHNHMMVATSGGNVPLDILRTPYEQGRVPKNDYYVSSKLGICASTAGSDGFNVAKFMPDDNAVELTNGRVVEYDHLVINTALENVNHIQGFDEAYSQPLSPIFSSVDHSSWKVTDTKYQRFYGNYTHGDAYFVIPEAPFKGEVTDYNFLASSRAWDWFKTLGKVHPHAQYHVINGNSWFSQHDAATDAFFKSECEKRGIHVHYNCKVNSVDAENQTMVVENLKTGEKNEHGFGNLYALPSKKMNQSLLDSGLATSESNNLLDVDQHTLRHKRYPNIFGLGEINNLPTTNGWYSGHYQTAVVTHNVFRNLKGLPLNGKYDGASKCPVYLDFNKVTFAQHNYDGPVSGSLNMSGGGVADALAYGRYMLWSKVLRKKFGSIYTSKTLGPPYGRFNKYLCKFPELSAEEAEKDSMRGYHVVRKEGEHAPAHH